MKIIRRFTKSFHYGQKGFTLVELLIVIAILGILAAVAIPNLVSFIGTGGSEAQATELDVVQTSMIAVMAGNHITAVDALLEANRVSDLAGLPLVSAAALTYDFDDYLVYTDVAYWYYWDTTGLVSQSTTAPAP